MEHLQVEIMVEMEEECLPGDLTRITITIIRIMEVKGVRVEDGGEAEDAGTSPAVREVQCSTVQCSAVYCNVVQVWYNVV